MSNKHFKGFTLAEVLITLGIIGVVAAMTMPSLIQKHQEKETVVRLKKVYSLLSQVQQKVVFDNGELSTWSDMDNEKLIGIYKPYFNVIKDCSDGETTGCFAESYTCFNGQDYPYMNDGWSFIINDGSTFKIYWDDSSVFLNEPTYAVIHIDLNGKKHPNTLGKDVFSFFVTKNKIIPFGIKETTNVTFAFERCTRDGHGCAAWVLYNENMDYMRCPDKLSWDGKHKCK